MTIVVYLVILVVRILGVNRSVWHKHDVMINKFWQPIKPLCNIKFSCMFVYTYTLVQYDYWFQKTSNVCSHNFVNFTYIQFKMKM